MQSIADSLRQHDLVQVQRVLLSPCAMHERPRPCPHPNHSRLRVNGLRPASKFYKPDMQIASAQVTEKGAQQRGGGLCPDPIINFGHMMALRMGKNARPLPDTARFRVGRAIIKPPQTRM